MSRFDYLFDNQPVAQEKPQEKGFFSNFGNLFASGFAGGIESDLETVEQLGGDAQWVAGAKQTFGEVSDQAINNVSPDLVAAMNQKASEGFDDLDWWLGNLGQLTGTVGAFMATGFGVGSVVKLGAKGTAKIIGKNMAEAAVKKGLSKSAANAIGTVTAGMVMGGGDRAKQARDEFLGLDDQALDQTSGFSDEYWKLKDSGFSQDIATLRNKAKENLAETAASKAFANKKAIATDLLASGIGGYVGGLGSPLSKITPTPTTLKGKMALGATKEASTEALQEGITQRASNEALQELGVDRDVNYNVGEAALAGGLLGMPSGMVGGAFDKSQPEKEPEHTLDPTTEKVKETNETLGEAMESMDKHSASVKADVTNFDIPAVARQAGATNDVEAGRFGDVFTSPLNDALRQSQAQTVAEMVNEASQFTEQTPQDREVITGAVLPPEQQTGVDTYQGEVNSILEGELSGGLLGSPEYPFSVPVGQTLASPTRQIKDKNIIFGEDGRAAQQQVEQTQAIEKHYDEIKSNQESLLPHKDIVFAGNESGVNVSKSGKPFKSEKEARSSKLARKAKREGLNIKVVPFGNGYGWQVSNNQEAVKKQSSANQATEKQPEVNNITEQTEKLHNIATGKKTKVYTPSNNEIETEYQLVEANELVASNDIVGAVNPKYPSELQPRDRSRAASQVQVQTIAKNIKPERLGSSNETDRGAPIVKNGVVESGNGRTIALKEAYRTGGAEGYKQYLRDNAQEFGLTIEQVNSIEQPVLVRNRLTDMTTAQRKAYTVDSNRSAGIEQGPAELAKSDASLLDEDDMKLLFIPENGDLLSPANSRFVNAFVKRLGSNESSKYRQANGEWNSQFAARINNAIFAKGYNDKDLLSSISESTTPESKNLLNTLMNVAGAIAEIKGLDENQGVVLGDTFAAAVQLIIKARRQNTSVMSLTSQTDLLSGGTKAEVETLAVMLDSNIRSAKNMQSLLRDIANQIKVAAQNKDQADIFSGEVTKQPTVAEVINNVAEQRAGNQPGNEQVKPSSGDLFSGSQSRQQEPSPTNSVGANASESTSESGSAERVEKPSLKDRKEKANSSKETTPQENIDDVGEVIKGAKKEIYAFKNTDLSKDEIENLPLSKIWPKTLFDNLDNKFAEAFAFSARENIPTKPQLSYKKTRWANNVKAMLSLMEHAILKPLSDGVFKESIIVDAAKRHPELYKFIDKIQLLNNIDKASWSRIGRVVQNSYSVSHDLVNGKVARKKLDTPREVVQIQIDGTTHEIEGYKSVVDATNKINKLLSNDKPSDKPLMKFEIRGRTGRYFINKKGDRDYTQLKTFNDLKEAKAFLKDSHNELVELWDKNKAFNNIHKKDVRGSVNQERAGNDWRKGKDVTAEQFREAFGFRGVQFGNYVKNGTGDKSRQSMINQAYDGLMDLSVIVGAPPKALSLNGELALAFGARGSGNAMAHYEPGQVVINLTKGKGAGSLAHEWFHALDNYFAKKRGSEFTDSPYITKKPEAMMVYKKGGVAPMTKAKLELRRKQNPSAGIFAKENWQVDPNHASGVRPEVEAAFAELVKQLDLSDMSNRATNIDAGKKDGYWSRIIERSARSFESYTKARVESEGYSSDYLVNINSYDQFVAMGKNPEKYPYLKDTEIPAITTAFDRLFNTLKTKKTDQGVMLFSKSKVKKNAKGMSANQAQNVADKFIESLNNANGITVKILQSNSDAEKLWRMSLDGATVKGAYSDKSKTVYIIADNISNIKDLKQTLAHETIAHGGLDTVFTPEQHKAFINRIRKTKGRKAFNDFWNRANRDYRGDTDQVKAEEIFARFVENEPQKGELKYWWNAFKRWIATQFSKVGIKLDSDSEIEAMREMMEAIIQGFKAKQYNNSLNDSGYAFSQTEDNTFKPKPIEAESYKAELSRSVKSLKSTVRPIKLGGTPKVLTALGAPSLDIYIRRDTVRKATNKAKENHDVPMSVIENLPELLADPVAVFDNNTKSSSKIVLINAMTETGKPIIVPIHLQVSEGKLIINRVASAYGVDGLKNKKLIYINKKKNPELSRLVHMLKMGSDRKSQDYDSSILTPDDIVNNSDLLFSKTEDTRTAKEKLGLEEGVDESIVEKAKAKTQEKIDTLKSSSFWKRLNEGMFDGLSGIKQAEDSVGVTDPNKQGYVSARLASGLADVLHGVFNYGAPQWKDGVIQRKEDTKGLLEVFGGLGDDLNNWLAWMGAQRAEKLAAEGKENNLSQADIDELKALANGKEAEFEAARIEYNKINSAILDVAQGAGLLSTEQRAAFDEEYYVPFFRDMGETDPEMDDIKRMIVEPHTRSGIAGQSAQIKSLKGGKQSTKDLLENIIARQSTLIDASLKNKAMLEVTENLSGTDYMQPEASEEIANLSQAELNKVHRVKVMRNGKAEAYVVSDPSLLRALIHINDIGSKSLFNKVGRSAKRFLTAGITLSPDFIFKNFVRDAAHAWMVNKDNFKIGTDSVNGLKKAFAEDEAYRDLIFSGAAFQGGYIHGADPEAGAQQIRRALRAKGLTKKQINDYLGTVINNGAELLEKYRGISDKVENANRLSTYEAALTAGKSKRQAAYEAKDLMDYSLKGNFKLIGTMIDVLPFFNARLQGMSKLVRAAKAGDNDKVLKVLSANLAMKGMKVAAFSLALAALNEEDEDYQALPDWDKDANWHIFADGEHIRVPKPFELGIVFGTMPERLFNYGTGAQTSDDLTKAVSHAVFNTLALNPIPQAALPLIEAKMNKSFFRDSPIEGMADQNKQAEDRYASYTSELSKMLGDMFGASPKKIDHMIKGYTGTIGGYVLGASDIIAQGIMGKETASTPINRYPVIKAFYQGDGPKTNTKFANEFYEALEVTKQAYGSYKRAMELGDTSRQQEILENDGDKLKSRVALNRIQRATSKLGKQSRAINDNTNLSSSQKREALDNIQRKKNALYHQAYVRFNLGEW